jgi:hypothetical protein
MKKLYLIAVLTLTCLFGLSEAHAQDVDTVVANVPFEFVAGGTTLPAGTYRVSRVYPAGRSVLAIQSSDNSVFVLPVVIDGVFDGAYADHGELSFVHVGDKNFLSKVETPDGAYTIKTSRAMTKVAQIKDHGTGSSSSGTN